MPILTRTCLMVALLLAACNSADHGQPSLVGCLVDEEHVVTDTASIPAGFTLSPADARTLALGQWTGELERDDGGAVTLTLELDANGAMLLQRRSWRAPTDGGIEPADAALACEDTYALPVALVLRALPDLDIDVATVLTVSASGSASFAARLAAVDHTGNAAPAAADLAGPGTVTMIELLLDGWRREGPWAGDVGFGIERHHGADGDGDGSVSFSQVGYGSWSAPGDADGALHLKGATEPTTACTSAAWRSERSAPATTATQSSRRPRQRSSRLAGGRPARATSDLSARGSARSAASAAPTRARSGSRSRPVRRTPSA